MFWKLTLTRQYTWLDSPDMTAQVAPWFQMESRAMRHGHFPLWDPYEWGGESLIGQMQPGAAYPPNWLLFLLGVNRSGPHAGFISTLALHWYFVLIHFMGALFCYWLCRDLKRSRLSAALAGIAFGCSGYMATTDWPQMMNGAIWFPLIFLFFLRALDVQASPRWAGLSGACLGVAFLSGHHQAPVFITLTMGGCWLFLIRRHWQAGALRQAAAKLGLFGALTALVSAFQVLPAVEYGKLSLRWVGGPEPVTWNTAVPYSVHFEYSLAPVSLLGTVIPGIFYHAIPFIGWSVVILAGLAVAAAWRDLRVRILGAIAIGGLIYSLGGNAIFEGWIYSLVPDVDKARNPSMAILVFHFGAAVLAAFGLDALSTDAFRIGPWPRRMRRLLIASAAVLAIIAAVFWFAQRDKVLGQAGIMLSAFAAALLAFLLYAFERRTITAKAGSVLLLGLLLFETGNVTGAGYQELSKPNSQFKQLTAHRDIADWLKRQPGPVRIELDPEKVQYNFGDWYAIDSFDIYLASLTTDMTVQGERWVRNLFGISFFVGDKPRRPDQHEVFTGSSGLKIYRNPDAFPRVWTVHEAISIPNTDGLAVRLDALGPDLRKKALLINQTPQLDTCPGADRATVVSRGINDMVIDADMACKGMLIAGESYFPGWHATVDGAAQPIWQADTLLRGVVVPTGHHRIAMTYRPASAIVGAILTAIGFVLVIALARGVSRR